MHNICEFCGVTYQTKRKLSRSCSPPCHWEMRKKATYNKYKRPCEKCGALFSSRHEYVKCCSKKCGDALRTTPKIKKKCLRCNATFLTKTKIYCSPKCSQEDARWQAQEAFWAKLIYQENGCRIWPGATRKGNHLSYGYVQTERGKVRAHRYAWVAARGQIPKGMQINHHCDVPLCCNPDHLYLGTHADNMRDAVVRNRFRKKV